MFLNINYPSGVALIANILALICHTVQFVYLAKYQDPANWASKIPPKYIMTFISGVESCMMAYFFLRARHIVRRKSIFIIIFTMGVTIAAIVLNAMSDDKKPWVNNQIYYGGMYYGQCSSLVDNNSRLRCQLIDATFILLIIAIGCWFIALFADKPKKNYVQKGDIEQQPRPSTTSKRMSSETPSVYRSYESDGSSTLVGSRKTKRNSTKPPKQLPTITRIEEDNENDEVTKFLVTSTRTESYKLVREETKSKRLSSNDDLPKTSFELNIKPLKALDTTEPRKSYVGRRSLMVNPKPKEPTLSEEPTLKNEEKSGEEEPEKAGDK